MKHVTPAMVMLLTIAQECGGLDNILDGKIEIPGVWDYQDLDLNSLGEDDNPEEGK